MLVTDFDFNLPKELIAQYPSEKRDESRLLVLNKNEKTREDAIFKNIGAYLPKNALLVVNETKVFPARVFGKKNTGAKVEIFLLENKGNDIWQCLVKPGKRLKIDTEIFFGDKLSGKIIDHCEDGSRLIKFAYDGVFWEVLSEYGNMPLPPYIERKAEENDSNRYQTVYAKKEGAVAAPTAGLHFTEKLISELKAQGIDFTSILLHVGIGTFRPVKVDNIFDHKMHKEYYEVSKETAEKINQAKREGRKIIAVGTTSVRTLETIASDEGFVEETQGWSDIFIYPGYKFKAVDGIITNFHLPKSTLIMLVSAFAGKDFILDSYDYAVENKYRFFSYGDSMLIL